MQPNKRDDEFWYVTVLNKSVEINTIHKNQKGLYKLPCVFDDYEDAKKCQKHLYLAYFETFQRRPLIKIETIEQYLMELIEIELTISERLKDYPNYAGIDFIDVSANGIQIRGFHKQLTGMCFGTQPTIKYDFSNYKDCIEEFVEAWKSNDTYERLQQYNSFNEATSKWGFN